MLQFYDVDHDRGQPQESSGEDYFRPRRDHPGLSMELDETISIDEGWEAGGIG